MASVISVSSPFGTALSASISSASVSTTARAARLGLATCALALPELEPFTPSTASLARFAGASDIALRVDRRQPFQRRVGSRHATPTALAFPVSRDLQARCNGTSRDGGASMVPHRRTSGTDQWAHLPSTAMCPLTNTPYIGLILSMLRACSFSARGHPPSRSHRHLPPRAPDSHSRRRHGPASLYGPPASRPTGHTVTRGSWPRPGAAARRPGRLRGAHVLRSRRPPPRRGSVRAPAPRAAAP